MKIKNDYVEIKNKDKNIKFHNTILQTYIDKVINRISTTNYNTQLIREDMRTIYIKFDNELEFDEDTVLSTEDFDIMCNLNYSKENEISGNFSKVVRSISIKNNIWYKTITSESTLTPVENFEEYIGKKVTAIAWGMLYPLTGFPSDICACFDTSNYNLYFSEDLVISRQDTITTDQIFNGIGINENYSVILNNNRLNKYIKVVSIGLGYYPSVMEYETTDFTVETTNNSVTFSELNSVEKTPLFPATNLYPSANLYPSGGTARYFIIKYNYSDDGETDSGIYYLSTPINDLTGDLKLTINVERNDD